MWLFSVGGSCAKVQSSCTRWQQRTCEHFDEAASTTRALSQTRTIHPKATLREKPVSTCWFQAVTVQSRAAHPGAHLPGEEGGGPGRNHTATVVTVQRLWLLGWLRHCVVAGGAQDHRRSRAHRAQRPATTVPVVQVARSPRCRRHRDKLQPSPAAKLYFVGVRHLFGGLKALR